MEGSRQFAQAGRHWRLQHLSREFLTLRAKEPSEVKAAEVATQQVRAQGQQRAHPAAAIVPVLVQIHLRIKTDDQVSSSLSYPGGFTRKHGTELFVVGQLPRKPKVEHARSPIRDVNKRVEVLFQKFEGIGLQISPLVVNRKTRRSDHGACGYGSQCSELSLCQRLIYRPKVVILVFAHHKTLLT